MQKKRLISVTGGVTLGLILAACGAAPQGMDLENTPDPALTTSTPILADTTAMPDMDLTTTPATGITDITTTPASDAIDTTPISGATDTMTTPATGTTTDTTTTPAAGTSGAVTLGDALISDERLSTLNALLEQTGLATLLEAIGPVTIFAPTDEAFAALPQGTLESLSNDLPALQRILFYHSRLRRCRPARLATPQWCRRWPARICN